MRKGGALDMIAYSIGILTLIKNLKTDFPGFTQPWYADNAVVLGTFSIIEAYLHSLERHGLGQGYYLKHAKTIMIVHTNNIKARKCLAYVMDLMCVQERVILAVI